MSEGATRSVPTKARPVSAFAVFDKSSDAIDPEELCAFLTNPGGVAPLSLEQAKAFIEHFDKDRDGMLDKEKLIQACAIDGALMEAKATAGGSRMAEKDKPAKETDDKRAAREAAAYEAA
eukprot:7380855-Prymnesium_polylepis.1